MLILLLLLPMRLGATCQGNSSPPVGELPPSDVTVEESLVEQTLHTRTASSNYNYSYVHYDIWKIIFFFTQQLKTMIANVNDSKKV